MASIGPVSISTGSVPTRQVSTIRARGVRPSAPAFSSVVIITAAAPSEICDELPAVWTPFSRATGFSDASFSSVVSRRPSSRLTVCVVPVGLPSSSTSGASIVDVLAGEAVLLPRLRGALLGREAEGVGVLAGDAPLVGDALGALELRGHLVLLEVGLRDRDAEPERLVAGRCRSAPGSSPRRRRRVPRSITPEPTSDDTRLVACWLEPHCVSTVVAAVDSGRPAASQAVRAMLNACSPTWLTQPPTTCPTSDGVDAGAIDDRPLHVREHLRRVHGGQTAVALADRRAHGIDDDGGR